MAETTVDQTKHPKASEGEESSPPSDANVTQEEETTPRVVYVIPQDVHRAIMESREHACIIEKNAGPHMTDHTVTPVLTSIRENGIAVGSTQEPLAVSNPSPVAHGPGHAPQACSTCGKQKRGPLAPSTDMPAVVFCSCAPSTPASVMCPPAVIPDYEAMRILKEVFMAEDINTVSFCNGKCGHDHDFRARSFLACRQGRSAADVKFSNDRDGTCFTLTVEFESHPKTDKEALLSIIDPEAAHRMEVIHPSKVTRTSFRWMEPVPTQSVRKAREERSPVSALPSHQTEVHPPIASTTYINPSAPFGTGPMHALYMPHGHTPCAISGPAHFAHLYPHTGQ